MATKSEQFRLQVTPWFFHYCNGRLSDAQRLRHFHLSFLDFFTQFGEVDIEQDVCRHRLSFGRDFGFFVPAFCPSRYAFSLSVFNQLVNSRSAIGSISS